MFSLFQPILAGIDPISWIVIAITVASTAVSYVSYTKAKKAAQASTQQKRGLLYNSRASALPRRILYGRYRMGGIEINLGVTGTENEFLHIIHAWSEGPNNRLVRVLFDGVDTHLAYTDEPSLMMEPNLGKYIGFFKFQHTLGTTDQTALGVGTVPNQTVTDKCLGTAVSWSELKYDPEVFPNGLPQISAVWEGRSDIYDPREDGLIYTANPALAQNHYMTLEKMGPGIKYADEVNEDKLIAAANECDEELDLSSGYGGTGTGSGGGGGDGGTELRYTFNGVVELDQSTENIIKQFRTAMAGVNVYANGYWNIYPGVYRVPTFVIDKDNIVGPIVNHAKSSKRERFNTVRGVFSNEITNWQPTDFPEYRDLDDIAEDDGEILPEDIDLLNTDSTPRARRIAKIYQKKTRFQRKCTVQCDASAIELEAGITTLLNFPELGYDMTPMDVLSFDLTISKGELVCTMNLQETHPSIYEWDPYADNDGAGNDLDSRHVTSWSPPDNYRGNNKTDSENLYYPDIIGNTPIVREVYCRSTSDSMNIVGHPEFSRPSVPPVYYLSMSFEGEYTGRVYALPEAIPGKLCSGAYVGKYVRTYSGAALFDALTGDLTTKGNDHVIEYNSTDDVTTDNTYDLDGSTFPGPHITENCPNTVVREKTEWEVIPTGECCVSLPDELAQVHEGGLQAHLSLENPAQDVADLIIADLPDLESLDYALCNGDSTLPCCYSLMQQIGREVTVTKAEFKAKFYNLNAGGASHVELRIYKEDLVTGKVVLDHTEEFDSFASIDGETEFEYELPMEMGFAFFVGAMKISVL